MALSALFLWLTFRRVDYGSLWTAMKGADYLYLLPAATVNLFQFYLRSLRWGYLMEPLKVIGTLSLFSATTIGFMANNILPARIGEVVRAYAVGRREDVSISASFATIVVERVFDTVTVFIFMFLALILVDFPPEMATFERTLHGIAGILFILLAVFLALLTLLKNNGELFRRVGEKLLSPISVTAAERLGPFIDSFASGLVSLRRGRHLYPVMLHSMAIWFLSALPIHLILVSFGYALPFSVSLFILVVLAVAVALPSAPGYIGTFHYACTVGLGLFDIGREDALSVAIVLHALNFFPVTIVGLVFLWRSNISLAEAERLEGRVGG